MDYIFYSLLLVCIKAGQSLLQLLPYVLLGVILGELLKLTSWTKLVYRGATKSPLLCVPVAAILGMVSPLCTFGTVPVVIQLLRARVPISPLAAFLATSAMMNPQLFIMTWGGLGSEMALVRAFSVLLFGLLLGALLYLIPSRWIINRTALNGEKGSDAFSEAAAVSDGPDGIAATNALENERTAIIGRQNRKFIFKVFIKDALKNLEFVGFYMVIGVILGASLEVYVPGYWIASLFKPGSWVSVMLAGLMGVPLYACGGGVIPLVRSFLQEGMSKGSALAFLIVGPATRVTPLMALAAVLRLPFLVAYIVLLLVFSLAAGLLYT